MFKLQHINKRVIRTDNFVSKTVNHNSTWCLIESLQPELFWLRGVLLNLDNLHRLELMLVDIYEQENESQYDGFRTYDLVTKLKI